MNLLKKKTYKYLKRIKYKKYNILRKTPEKYIPFNMFYCYGQLPNKYNKKYNHNCPFLIDDNLDYHLKCFRNKTIKHEYCLEDFSAKCSLTGNWVFDYCKHCGINEKFLLDKEGNEIW